MLPLWSMVFQKFVDRIEKKREKKGKERKEDYPRIQAGFKVLLGPGLKVSLG